VRLYDEQSFASRPGFTDPEIKRTGLAGTILRMKAFGLGSVEDFPFIDPPPPRSVTEGYRVLDELGALDAHRELTPLGERLARFPVDPRIGRMILAGADRGCLRDVLVVAAALHVQDPRERPREAQQKADELHRRFRDDRSDFVGLLRLWAFVREAERKGSSHLRRVCKESFLSFLRVREWTEVHRQLEDVVRELRLESPGVGPAANSPDMRPPAPPATDDTDALHRALLTGLLSKVGQWNAEHRIYIGARQTRFAIHPSSSLARKPPAWLMAFELVETTGLFARMAAKLEPEWLLDAAPHLLTLRYADPHWSEKSARASVKQHATLFGLPVFRDRSVEYARIAPAEARRMFIDHALVRGEYRTRGSFQSKNRELFDEVARLRDKARRSDMLADDEALVAIFDRRLPASVVDGATFEAWREEAEKSDPRVLFLSLEDVLAGDPGLVPSDYPDSVAIHGAALPATYRFDPSAEDDGVTLTVALVHVPQIHPGELDWTVPGLHREKIASLLHELPRAIRRELGPIPELAQVLAERLVPFQGPMIPALAAAIATACGVDVPEACVRPDAVPAYLRLTCRVVDDGGRIIAQSKDIADLWGRLRTRAMEAWKEASRHPRWERKGLTRWDFGDLAPFVTRDIGGAMVRAYPAIVDRETSVELALFETHGAAEAASRAGVRRLLTLAARADISALVSRIPAPFARANGAEASRAEGDAFRATVLARIVDEAFGLGRGAPLPRTQRAFEDLVAIGSPRIATAFALFGPAIARASAELDRTLQALRSAAKHPGAQVAIAQIRAHLERLFPADLLAWAPLARLEDLPRYLRAAQTRLGRAIADPRKDAEKLAPIAPLWAAYLAKEAAAHDRETALALRWSFEELRVTIFAPELKARTPVSVSDLATAVAALR
jgi:ATP-dependent helicase HrpA